ncbi:MAG: FAD-dependent oxidoreductase [Alphaproteobacteria bacterium]|nr:FAD-dependent oxidoreductase [Alphaproteobacteria bacterium]
MRIAIVGSGISGLGAAWLLREGHAVTLYEKETRLGGHAHTVSVEYDGRQIPVDIGFIVFNHLNYPNLTALFAELGVPCRLSDMSFGVSLDGGRLEWSSNSLTGVFAQKRNLASPSFLTMLTDMVRFNTTAPAHRQGGVLAGLSLGDYLAERRYSRAFREFYLLPMGAAIWSVSCRQMLDFPAESFVSFFENHRLLSVRRPGWWTVDGGSQSYVSRLAARLDADIRLRCGVRSIQRGETGVLVRDESGGEAIYDQVILACHSDQALALLADASEEERAVLGPMRYGPNTAFLHRDESLMPRRRRSWASWNYLTGTPGRAADPGQGVGVTYWMNRLQSIDADRPLFVSLNPPHRPAEDKIFLEHAFAHPIFDQPALAAQKRLGSIQGVNRTWFCGAWSGYGFHEDGLASGLDVAERLSGRARPWRVAARGMDLRQAAE